MIRLLTLGALDLHSSDETELRAVLAQPRRVALLAYLALAAPRGPRQRDALLALFWPERDVESARNALNQALHFLRRHLGGDAFTSRGNEIGLAPDHLWCDAIAFDHALESGRPDEALSLYRGNLLEGFHIGGAPEFERWLEAERARLADRYMHATEFVAAQFEARGDFAAAAPLWRQLAARDPLSARITLRLMRCLVAQGDAAAAIRHAHVHQTLLRQELSAEPAPEIRTLVRELQSTPQRAGGAPGAARRELGIAVVTSPLTPTVGETHEEASVGPRRGPASDASPESQRASKTERPPTSGGVTIPRPGWRRAGLVAAAGIMVFFLLAPGSRARQADEQYLQTLYARGQQAEISRTLVGLQSARAAYELALDRDSTFALAYAGLAFVHHFMADYAYAPVGPALDSARLMALRAVALDSLAPETRTARAVTLGNAGEFDAAEHEFRRAVQLGPDNARAHYWYSVLLVGLGRGTEALREANRAAELDPVPPRGLTAMRRYSTWLITGKRPHLDSAVTHRRPILKLEPGEPWARSREAVELAQAGRCTEAHAEIERAVTLVPSNNFRMLPPIAEVHWRCGEPHRARQILAEMKSRPDVEDHGYRVALIHVLFGELDSAFDWLPRQRWTIGELSGLSADQTLDPLRSDPRFDRLLHQIGIR